jgi:HSP20 family molecular chaperone IbpA
MQSSKKLFTRRIPRTIKQTTTFKPTTNQTRTMAFFPRAFYNNTPSSDASFTPLFRLLDEFDNYSRQGQGRRTGLPAWQPKFDVRETSDTYELHGELPGMAKENVNIEFTDPQTMHIRGKVERTYTAGTPPSGHLEDTSMSGAITEGEEGQRRNSHQATVEDEAEAKNKTNASADQQQVATQNTAKKPVDKAKYWLTERSIGEFSRSFSFPSRVEQEGVSASLKDGVLNVTVPKAKKHETRRIAIE